MKKCNQIKLKAKKLYKQIDDEKSGLVKSDVFFDVLDLLKIKLREQDISKIRQLYGQSGDKINYKIAMAMISVDIGVGGDNPL